MWRTRTLPWFVLAIQPAIVGLVALHGIARSVAELAVLLVFLGTAVRYLVLAVRDDPVRARMVARSRAAGGGYAGWIAAESGPARRRRAAAARRRDADGATGESSERPTSTLDNVDYVTRSARLDDPGAEARRSADERAVVGVRPELALEALPVDAVAPRPGRRGLTGVVVAARAGSAALVRPRAGGQEDQVHGHRHQRDREPGDELAEQRKTGRDQGRAGRQTEERDERQHEHGAVLPALPPPCRPSACHEANHTPLHRPVGSGSLHLHRRLDGLPTPVRAPARRACNHPHKPPRGGVIKWLKRSGSSSSPTARRPRRCCCRRFAAARGRTTPRSSS